MDDMGRGAVVSTEGNEDCHVILRGGTDGPNYGADAVADAAAKLAGAGLPGRVVIDCSHAGSGKDHVRQASVAARSGAAGSRWAADQRCDAGELPGCRCPVARGSPAHHGQSVTDKCMDWDATDLVLRELAKREGLVSARLAGAGRWDHGRTWAVLRGRVR